MTSHHDTTLAAALERAVHDGLLGVAVVDRGGVTIARAGELGDEPHPAVARVLFERPDAELMRRLYTGDVLTAVLTDREITVCALGGTLFLCATYERPTPRTDSVLEDLRLELSRFVTAHPELMPFAEPQLDKPRLAN